ELLLHGAVVLLRSPTRCRAARLRRRNVRRAVRNLFRTRRRSQLTPVPAAGRRQGLRGEAATVRGRGAPVLAVAARSPKISETSPLERDTNGRRWQRQTVVAIRALRTASLFGRQTHTLRQTADRITIARSKLAFGSGGRPSSWSLALFARSRAASSTSGE